MIKRIINFLISERIKLQHYQQLYSNNYFWRTVQKQEVDFVEERNGLIYAYEFKWKKKPKDKIPVVFLREYNAFGNVVDRPINCSNFVLKLNSCYHLRTFPIITCFKRKKNVNNNRRSKLALCR